MSTISAGTTTTTGYVVTSDTTGALVLKTGASGTTAVTIGSDQSVTFAGSQTFSGGTANGVLYLNGSKVATSGSALTFDGTDLQVANGGIYAANGTGSNLSIGFKQSSTVKFRLRYDIAGDSISLVDGSGNFCQTWAQGNTFTSFGIGGSEQMRLTSTGLGIGTSSPDQALVVNKASGSTYVKVSGANNVNNDLALHFTDGTNNAYFGMMRGTSGGIAGALHSYTGGAIRSTLDSSGNLGIGTTSPVAKLDVSGGSIRVNEDGVGTKILTIRSNWAGVDPAINVTTSNALLLMTANTERARITSSGNLLLGTTSDQGRKLQVSGAIALVDAALNSIVDMSVNSSGVMSIAPYNGSGSTISFSTNPSSGGVTERVRIHSAGGMSIGTTTASPASGLRVQGGLNPYGGIVNTNIIAGFVSSNYSGTRYWLLHRMQTGAGVEQSAFNCMGDLHASSYTTWNLSNLWIRREYASTNVFAGITGVIKSGVTVSVVDITYSNVRYVAIKFAGGDPGIEANLVGYLMDQMYTNGTDASFINGTAGVTEIAVIATY